MNNHSRKIVTNDADNNDLLDAVTSLPPRWQTPPEPPLKQYGKKIAGGVACSAFIAFVMHLPYIKVVILWACHIVILLFGRPEGVEKVENKIKDLAGKGREVIKAHVSPGESESRDDESGDDTEKRKPGRIEKLIHKTSDAIKEKAAEPAKKVVATVVEKGEAIKEKADEGVKTVKDTAKDVIGALKDGAVRGKDAVVTAVVGTPEARAAALEKQENMQRAALEKRAAVRGVKIDKEWSLAQLHSEVQQAELKWQAAHGPNAQCPICHFGIRIKTKRAENRRCPRCSCDFSSKTALTLGAPPPIPINTLFRR